MVSRKFTKKMEEDSKFVGLQCDICNSYDIIEQTRTQSIFTQTSEIDYIDNTWDTWDYVESRRGP